MPHSGMNRFFVEAVHMYGPTPGKRRWSYRVRDKDHCVPHFGAKTVATTHDPEIADTIAAALESGAGVTCLQDLQNQIATLRQERDSARADRNNLQNDLNLETAKNAALRSLVAERDDARSQVNHSENKWREMALCRGEALTRVTAERDGASAAHDLLNEASMAAVSRSLGVSLPIHIKRLEEFKASRKDEPAGWTAEEVSNLLSERDTLRKERDAAHKIGAFVLHPSADVVRDQTGNLWARRK